MSTEGEPRREACTGQPECTCDVCAALGAYNPGAAVARERLASAARAAEVGRELTPPVENCAFLRLAIEQGALDDE